MCDWSVVIPDIDSSIPLVDFDELSLIDNMPTVRRRPAAASEGAQGQQEVPQPPLAPSIASLPLPLEGLAASAEALAVAAAEPPAEAQSQEVPSEPSQMPEPQQVHIPAPLPLQQAPVEATWSQFVSNWTWQNRRLLLQFVIRVGMLLGTLGLIWALTIAWSYTTVGIALTGVVTESASTVSSAVAATGVVVKAVANVTHMVSDVTVSMAVGGRSVLQEAASGVDLAKVTIREESQQLSFGYASGLQGWLQNSVSNSIPAGLRLELQAGVEALRANGGKHWAFRRHLLNVSQGTFWAVKASVTVTGGYWQLNYELTGATFEATWANPMWESMQYDVSAESQQILESLDRITTLQRQVR